MDEKKLFRMCVATSSDVVSRVRPEHFHNETPDTEWNVKNLLHHVLYELNWVPDLVNSATIDEVGNRYEGDIFGTNFHNSWDNAAKRAVSAVDAAVLSNLSHLSYGDTPVGDYIMQASAEQLIHAWDLGVGIGYQVIFKNKVAQTLYNYSLPMMRDHRPDSVFGPEISVQRTASIQTKLLALYGRNE